MTRPLNNPRQKRSKMLFTKEEDDRLRFIVSQYPSLYEVNWNTVAKKMKTRNAKQCRERWSLYLSNMYNRSPFTIDEKCKILYMVKHIGKRWFSIAKNLNNRSNVDVKTEFTKMARKWNIIKSDEFNQFSDQQMESFTQMLRKIDSLENQGKSCDIDIFTDFVALED